MLTEDQTREIRKAFDEYDSQGSGRMSLMDMGKLAADLGEPMTDEELELVKRMLDIDNLGIVEFSTLVEWWNMDMNVTGQI